MSVVTQVITESSASGAQVIDGSLLLQSSLNQYLGRTFSLGNRQTWTFSAWVKKTTFGSAKRGLFGHDSTNDHIRLQNNDDGGDSGKIICDAQNVQHKAKVTTFDENVIVVWRDLRNDPDGDVYAQILDSTGNSILEDNGQVICDNPKHKQRQG